MADSGMASRKYRANKALEGSPCFSCGHPLPLGEEVAQCNACQKVHHAKCWDVAGGCGNNECENRPLQALPQQPAPQAAAQPYNPYAPPGAAAPPAYPQPYGQPQAPANPMGAAPPPGQKQCPHCGNFVGYYDQMCVYCNNVTSPDGIYHGPQINAPGASAALAYGIVGFFICGIIFGPIAISKANQAKALIDADPQYKGRGMAQAGYIMGIVDIVFFVLFLLIRVIGAASSSSY